ncbi:MAG: ribbon-helix-helix protein, CopG family [Oscillatoriales cyanobacterium RM1_1_9]|nr:ribbon-helix-helix protein, CopG family [Oscillatoriales cyanobacterium SM2_3_0]NJO45672.1 ribbon-helix-helix protein, CopG family [Oscillatoriales cyanobacterium RM2_1_1]NJO70534.1 ribbon-helix-helix protein, CopG family [Oscillatoriales cyanobacterium RM1_1_9]
MSRRVSVYLPDKIADLLEKWAEDEGRTTSSLAAFLIEQAVRQNAESKVKKKDEG